MKARAVWLVPARDSDSTREELARILSLGDKDPALDSAAEAFRRATEVHELDLLHPAQRSDLAELKRDLESVEKALKKIAGIVKNMNEARFLDQHFFLANDFSRLLVDLCNPNDTDHGSGFAVMIEQLCDAVNDYRAESVADRGRGRSKDKTYTLPLMGLADWFSDHFPDKKLSHHKRSVFSNFAGLWLTTVAPPGDTPDPQRHIQTALDERKKRETA